MSGTMDVGYPRSIEDNFPGMDDEIDAAAYHYGTAASATVMFIHPSSCIVMVILCWKQRHTC